MRKLLLSLAAAGALIACSGGAEPGTTPVAWSGSPLALEAPVVAQDYHLDAVARAHEYLNANHLLDIPLTDERVGTQRDLFLDALDQGYWLHAQERAELARPEQLPRWRAALEGRHLGVALEATATVRQRQEAWLAEHGRLAGSPSQATRAADEAQWRLMRAQWTPQGAQTPQVVVDADKATQALLAARAWGFDPNTLHVPPELAHLFNESMLRVSSGLGLSFSMKNGEMVIQAIETDSPAGRSGLLREADVLKQIQLTGHSWVDALPPDRALTMLDEAVDSVGLAVLRDGKLIRLKVPMPTAAEKKAFFANQDQVRIHSEQWGTADKALRVIRVEMTLFYENGDDGNDAAMDVANALNRATAQSTDLVVLDLRRARGGAVPVALHTAGLFIKDGPVFALQTRGNQKQLMEDPTPGAAWEGPVQVWVGPQTMSAGEAVAMAVGDRAPAATIIGWPTFGKGTLQRRVEMDLQSARNGERSRLGELWVTMGELMATNGTSIQRDGVVLDYRLEGGTEEPWGERALANALEPRHASEPRPEPVVVKPSQWVHPGRTDAQALPMWRETGLRVARGELTR